MQESKAENTNPSICFITGQLGLGGAEKQLYLLVRGLLARNWLVSVITLNPDVGDYWEIPIRKLGVPLHLVSRDLNNIVRMIKVIKILSKIDPAIVHSWSLHSNLYAAISGTLTSVPLKLGSERSANNSSIYSKSSLLYKLSFLGLDGIVTNSDIASDLIRKRKPSMQIKTIYNGINIDDAMFSREDARNILRIPDNGIVIAGVGSLTKVKNFRALIKTFSIVNKEHTSTKLVIIGDGPQKKLLIDTANSLLPKDSFSFTGALPNAAKLFNGIDILCVPSLTEGIPNVIMEAHAAGVPVVAYDVGAISNLVQHRVSGFLIPTGNKAQFCAHLTSLILDRKMRFRMGQAGKKNIEEHFSSERMVNHFINFYQKGIIRKSGNN